MAEAGSGGAGHGLGAHVFISYAREDSEAAARLQVELLKAGAASVWLDRKSIEGGDDWKKEIAEGLLKTQVLVAVLTRHSVDEGRRWIRYEHTEAVRLLRPIVPLLFSDCELPDYVRNIQYVDFRRDWHEGFFGLMNALGKITLRAGERDQKFTDHCPPVGRAFVGRERDLQRVVELMEGDAAAAPTGRRSVAIQGMGGTGKTMLAEELVRRLAVRYPGGVTVEQRGQSPESAHSVLQRWAKCILGEYPQPQWSVVDVRSELQKKYGALLVLVDDVSEKDFGDVAELLKAVPADATRILTTRSTEIDSLGAVVYALPDFEEADALQLLRHRLGGKGEEPGEELLKELIAAVAGHALSLELIAGRCKHTRDLAGQVAKLAGRLARGDVGRIALDVVEKKGRKDLSVAVSLEESYVGLREHDAAEATDWARRFRALGVFSDGAMFDRTMATAVWGDADPDDDTVGDSLDGLFSRAMLNRDGTTGLYFLHPLLRAYAHGLLKTDPAESRSVWDRYLGHVTARARAGFSAPPQQWSAMEPLGPHVLHVAGVLAEVLGSRLGEVTLLSEPVGDAALPPDGDRGEIERALEFARSVLPYVLRRPETGERGRRCLAVGLASARGLGRPSDTVHFLEALGRWHDQRDPHVAEHYYASALDLAAASGDRARWATILSYQGELQRKLSRPQRAMELLEQALSIHEELGERRMQAMSLKSMGETQWRLGRHDAALELHRRALDIFASLGDRSGQGDMLNKIGSVRFNQGRHDEAIELFKEALHIHREVGNRSMEAEDLNDMGISYKYRGDVESALPRLVDAFITHRAIGSRRLQAISMCNLSSVYILQGLAKAAYELAGEALVLAREAEDLVTESWALSYQGLALQRQGEREAALPLFRDAVETSQRVGDRRGEAGHLGNLGNLCYELGRREEALALVKQAVDVMKAHELTQAFGGRRLADFDAMIASMESTGG
jgi:tetratricopeptide (TPR) repeat protein